MRETTAAQTTRRRRHSLCHHLHIFVALVFLAGCGGRDIEQVNLTGKVTYDGGPMPGPGTIYFTPTERAEGMSMQPGTASFDVDGSYAAGRFEPGDGLVPGKYSVRIHCWEVSPNTEDTTPVSFIPEKYTDATTSGLTVEIPADSGSMTKDFALVSQPED